MNLDFPLTAFSYKRMRAIGVSSVARSLTFDKQMWSIAIIVIFLNAILLGSTVANAAVVVRSGAFSLNPAGDGTVAIDLDGDGAPDIQIDASYETTSLNEGAFLLDMFGGARVAVTGNVTTSLSAGQSIRLTDLMYASAPDRILTGGVIADALGNPVSEGWGGYTSDELGNVILPPEGPTYRIDLFVVELANGVAWVDLDTKAVEYAGVLSANWAYLDSPDGEIFLTPVPELSIFTMTGMAFVFAVIRRRRYGDRIGASTD